MHAEGLGGTGDLATNVAKPEDAKVLSTDLEASGGSLGPLVGMGLHVGLVEAPRQGDHVAQGHLDHASAVAHRVVEDQYAMLGAGQLVHAVIADAA